MSLLNRKEKLGKLGVIGSRECWVKESNCHKNPHREYYPKSLCITILGKDTVYLAFSDPIPRTELQTNLGFRAGLLSKLLSRYFQLPRKFFLESFQISLRIPLYTDDYNTLAFWAMSSDSSFIVYKTNSDKKYLLEIRN